MVNVAGIRFRQAGKIYHFNLGGLVLKRGDKVIVETSRGVEFGTVVTEVIEADENSFAQPLKKVIRQATKEDIEKDAQNRIREKDAITVCKEKIRKHGLEMKLIDCEYTFDNSKMLFYFTAEGRKLRAAALLPHRSFRVRARVDQDGEGTESVPEYVQDLGCLRQADVLPQERGSGLRGTQPDTARKRGSGGDSG